MTDRDEKSKTIILMASQKGGVGKSSIAIAIIGWLRRRGLRVAAYDGDAVVSTTYLTLGEKDADGEILDEQDSHKGVVRYNLRDAAEAGILVNSFEEDAQVIVHDLPGGALQDLDEILRHDECSGIQELLSMIAEEGHRLTLLHVVTDDVATIISLGGYLAHLRHGARHVAVLNQAFSTEGGRSRWEGSETRRELQKLGGKEISFPALHEELARSLTLVGRPWLPSEVGQRDQLVSRQRLKIFNKVLEERLNLIKDWLF